MMQSLNDANVAVYTMDLSAPGTRHPWRDSLLVLANETGGDLYDNLSSYKTVIGRVSDANSGYYLLSYRSQSQAEVPEQRSIGDFHIVNKCIH